MFVEEINFDSIQFLIRYILYSINFPIIDLRRRRKKKKSLSYYHVAHFLRCHSQESKFNLFKIIKNVCLFVVYYAQLEKCKF